MRIGERGFTLVEILISIVILALMVGLLLNGLRLVTHHLGFETAELDRSSQVALVQNFLRAQLADAQPVLGIAGSEAVVDFTGGTHHLSFVSPALPSVSFGGFQRLSIDFDADTSAAGGTLKADSQPYRVLPDNPANNESETQADMTSRVLLDHVRTVAFSYFGSNSTTELPAWHETWREKRDLPALVRLSVVFSDGHTMPDLIVALRLADGR